MADLQPLQLGQLIDRSIGLWRVHWKPLFGLYVVVQLAQYILIKGWEVAARLWFPSVLGGQATIDAFKNAPEVALPQFAIGSALMGAAMLLTFFLAQLVGVASSRYLYPRLLGSGTPTIAEGVRFTLSRLQVNTAVFILSLAWGVAVTVLSILPGALFLGGAGWLAADGSKAGALAAGLLGLGLLTLGLVAALLWFFIRFLMVGQVIAVEDGSAMHVFRRTAELSSGRVGPGFTGWVKGRLTILVTVVSAIVLVVSFVTGLPALAVQVAWGNVLDPVHATPQAVPLLLQVPAQLLQVAASSVVAPIYVTFQVMFYADMRVRREGLDLAQKLEEPAT